MGESLAQTPSPPNPGSSRRLESWKEIATYLNRGIRTVIRWEQEEGLPVHRLHHDKRGSVYAFTTELDAWRESRTPAQLEDPPLPVRPTPRSGLRRYWVASLCAAVLLALPVYFFSRGRSQSGFRFSPLTSYAGTEQAPALSPDGQFVAFSWDGPQEENADIYVKSIGPGEPLRLTTDPARDNAPAWSPDARQIAFVRLLPDMRFGLYVVPVLGGAERRLATISRRGDTSPPRISWSPDGQWILVPHLADGTTSSLVLVSASTGEMRPVFANSRFHDVSGVISPDGWTLAFLRSQNLNQWQLNLVRLAPGYVSAGLPRPIGSPRYSKLAPIWTPDSLSVFSMTEDAGTFFLWRYPAAGARRPVLSSQAWPVHWTEVTMSRDGRTFVLGDSWNDLDIWRFDLSGASKPLRFLSSTASDINPAFSPEGRRIAFSSRRSGAFQIWLAKEDGSHERQLTSLDATLVGMPRWSPDGSSIAFDAYVRGEVGVWIISSEGGTPRRLTQAPDFGFNPSWSRDGRFIYFCSRRSGREEIWKIPVDSAPHPPAVQLTHKGGHNGFESSDGRFFYYAGSYQGGPILRIPSSGGDPIPVIPLQNLQHNMALSSSGIYYALSEGPRHLQSVWFYSFASGKSRKLLDTVKPAGIGLDVSPDGRFLLCTLIERRGGDLWLVESAR